MARGLTGYALKSVGRRPTGLSVSRAFETVLYGVETVVLPCFGSCGDMGMAIWD